MQFCILYILDSCMEAILIFGFSRFKRLMLCMDVVFQTPPMSIKSRLWEIPKKKKWMFVKSNWHFISHKCVFFKETPKMHVTILFNTRSSRRMRFLHYNFIVVMVIASFQIALKHYLTFSFKAYQVQTERDLDATSNRLSGHVEASEKYKKKARTCQRRKRIPPLNHNIKI